MPPSTDAPRPGAEPVLVTAPVVVSARGLGLDGPRGPVLDGVDLTVRAGSLLVLAGPAGSGRTSLLLTLAGRMVADRGEVEVLGQPLPRARRAVQRTVALGPVRGVNDLDLGLTVEEHVLERLALAAAPWWRAFAPSRSSRSSRPAAYAPPRPAAATGSGDGRPTGVDGLLVALFGAAEEGAPAPLDPGVSVRDLGPLDAFRLAVALAFVGRRRDRPRVLAVDDVDDLRDPAAVTGAWRLLSGLAGSDGARGPGGLTVLATCSDAASLPAGIRVAPGTVVERLS